MDDTPGSASSSSCSSSGASRSRGGSKPKTKLTFRIFFPLPPFEGIHFTALKAGQGAYNFTVRQKRQVARAGIRSAVQGM